MNSDMKSKIIGKSRMNEQERDAILKSLPMEGAMLEIGTYHGTLAAYWAENRPGLHVVSVDPFTDGHMAEAGDPEIWSANARKNQTLVQCTSLKFLHMYPGQYPAEFNAIFIDGAHDFKWASIDLFVSDLILAKDGIIMVHDYKDRINLAGIVQAVSEFCSERKYHIVKNFHRTVTLRRDGS